MSANKPRVLVLAHSPQIGGAELALVNLIESTKDDYIWDVAFVGNIPLHQKLLANVTKHVLIDLPWWCHEEGAEPKKVNLHALERNIATLERMAESADILLTNTITVPWLAFLAAKLKKPHIWYVHEFGDKDHNLQFELGYKESLNVIESCSSRVLTISNSVKNHLSQVIGTDKIDIIHQSIDLNDFLNIPLRSAFENRKVTVACLGAIKPSKGQLIAIESFSYLDKQKYELVVRGPNANQQYVERAMSLKTDGIEISTERYEPATMFSYIDILLMCSENEALGRVTLEGLAAGCIVIGFDSPSTRELLKDGRGILYSPNSPKILANKIKEATAQQKKFNIKTNRAFVSTTYGHTQQRADFIACVASSTKHTPIESRAYDNYLQHLKIKGLLISRQAHFLHTLKHYALRYTPRFLKNSIKRLI